MTQEIVLYLLLLVFLNLFGPLWFYRKSKKWEMALIACGLLWFIEAFLIGQCIKSGGGYEPMVKAVSLSLYVPVPFILSLIGILILLYKVARAPEVTAESK